MNKKWIIIEIKVFVKKSIRASEMGDNIKENEFYVMSNLRKNKIKFVHNLKESGIVYVKPSFNGLSNLAIYEIIL